MYILWHRPILVSAVVATVLLIVVEHVFDGNIFQIYYFETTDIIYRASLIISYTLPLVVAGIISSILNRSRKLISHARSSYKAGVLSVIFAFVATGTFEGRVLLVLLTVSIFALVLSTISIIGGVLCFLVRQILWSRSSNVSNADV
jgi:hypothetical protein